MSGSGKAPLGRSSSSQSFQDAVQKNPFIVPHYEEALVQRKQEAIEHEQVSAREPKPAHLSVA